MRYDPLHSHSSFPGGSVGTVETCNELCTVPIINTCWIPQGKTPLLPTGLFVDRHM